MKTIRSIALSFILIVVSAQLKAQTTTVDASTNMLSAYYGVKNALVADNIAMAKTQAKELLANVTNFPADKLDATQQKTWVAYQEKLEFDSRHISESPNIAHQREHFESLSKNFAEVIVGLKLNTAAVYKQYCPMKKAVWLSETAAIKNPYYGKQMLTCGRTTGTINVAK